MPKPRQSKKEDNNPKDVIEQEAEMEDDPKDWKIMVCLAVLVEMANLIFLVRHRSM